MVSALRWERGACGVTNPGFARYRWCICNVTCSAFAQRMFSLLSCGAGAAMVIGSPLPILGEGPGVGAGRGWGLFVA